MTPSPNLETSNTKNDIFLPLFMSFGYRCCVKRDQSSDFGLCILLLVEFKE